jgi:hypothetical protein
LFVGSPHKFCMYRSDSVLLEDADQQPMRRLRAVALVRNIPTHDAGAGNMAMHQWTRRAEWLEPVDLLEIP